MSSILDIDLDYFNLIENPEQRLLELLDWGDCPIAFVVEKHHKAYSRWKDRVKKGTLTGLFMRFAESHSPFKFGNSFEAVAILPLPQIMGAFCLKYLLTAWPGMAILRIYKRRWLYAYKDSKMG